MVERLGVKARIAREKTYLSEDVARARRAVTPSRVSQTLLLAGALLVVWAVYQWVPLLAVVILGIALAAYGLLLVDVDGADLARRRRR